MGHPVIGAAKGAQAPFETELAGRGAVKVLSSGSALDGGPALYLRSLHGPAEHGRGATFREIARFTPFGGGTGVRVAATATTTGSDLLVSGVGAYKTARVAKSASSGRLRRPTRQLR
jgi:hypothetical protein